MLLHIGGDVCVPLSRLILIVNARNMQPETRRFVERAAREHRLKPCEGAPKAYVLVQGAKKVELYASPIAAATLAQRLQGEADRIWMEEAAVLSVSR